MALILKWANNYILWQRKKRRALPFRKKYLIFEGIKVGLRFVTETLAVFQVYIKGKTNRLNVSAIPQESMHFED